MDISHLSYFWKDRETWFLEEVKSGIYEIVGRRKDGVNLEVIIEDDDLYDAIIQSMLQAGSRILNKDEVEELFKLNIFGDVDAKTEQRMMREYFEKHGLPKIQFDHHPDDVIVELDEDFKAMGEQTIESMLEELSSNDIKSTKESDEGND